MGGAKPEPAAEGAAVDVLAMLEKPEFGNFGWVATVEELGRVTRPMDQVEGARDAGERFGWP